MRRAADNPTLGRDRNPGAARWCDEHRRLECTKLRRTRVQCHAPAIRGTNACRLHGGISNEVAEAQGKARITAWSAIGAPPDGKALDAGVAVLGMLHQSWLRAHAYGEMLRRQVVDSENQPITLDEAVKADGLIGFRYAAAGKEGTIFAAGEEVRALVALEASERDRVVRFAKTAHDMGISKRMTDLAERWGDVVVTQIMLVMERLNLTPEQEARVPALIQAHLSHIDVDAINQS